MKRASNALKIILPLLALSLICFIFVCFFGVQNPFGAFKVFVSNCISAGVHWVVLVFLAGLIGIFLIMATIATLIPLMLFFLDKLWTRIILRAICAKNKFSYKAEKSIFASRKESAERADILIGMKDKTLHVHFIGVPFALINVLVFINDHEYRIFSTTRGKVAKLGGGAAVNMTSQRAAVFQESQRNISERYKSQEISEFPRKNPEFHIFVVEPGFVRAKYITSNELMDISAEVSIGNIIVCKSKTLKKRLKGELYSPLE